MNPIIPSGEEDPRYQALFNAVMRNDATEVGLVLDDHPDLDLNKPMPGNEEIDAMAPLHAAASNNFTDVMEVLIARGADVHGHSRPGDSWGLPIHAAAYDEQLESLMLLLRHDVDINAPDSKGNPCMIEVDCYNIEYIQALLNLGASLEPSEGAKEFSLLHRACVRGAEKPAAALLRVGADPYLLNEDDKPPIYYVLTNHRGSACADIVSHYAALPRFKKDHALTFDDVMKIDPLTQHRMVDNPYNWRAGLAEQMLEWQGEAGKDAPLLDKAALMAPGPQDSPSIAEHLLATRQGSVLFTLLTLAGEAITAGDLSSGGELTEFASKMAQYGQIPAFFKHQEFEASVGMKLMKALPPEQADILPYRQTMLQLQTEQTSKTVQGRA